MYINKKAQFTFDDIMHARDTFLNEKGVEATHCLYNPKLVDIEYFKEQVNTLFNTDQSDLGYSEISIAGIMFIEDNNQTDMLNFKRVVVIE